MWNAGQSAWKCGNSGIRRTWTGREGELPSTNRPRIHRLWLWQQWFLLFGMIFRLLLFLESLHIERLASQLSILNRTGVGNERTMLGNDCYWEWGWLIWRLCLRWGHEGWLLLLLRREDSCLRCRCDICSSHGEAWYRGALCLGLNNEGNVLCEFAVCA